MIIYIVSLTLVGVGWNFVFISATVLLSTVYQNNEKFKVQAFNDMLVFGCSSAAVFFIGLLGSVVGN